MINPGKHIAKLIDYTVSQNKSGQPQVEVHFDIPNQGQITWIGHTTPKDPAKEHGAQDVTMKALKTMGFKGANILDIHRLYDGSSTMELDALTDYELDIRHETWNNEVRAKVAFVNKPGEGGGVGKRFTNKQELMAAMGKLAPAKSGANSFGL